MLARVSLLASIFVVLNSCSGKLKEADTINLAETPMQTVEQMFAVDTKNGVTLMRMEADKMERYENDSLVTELFPEGFYVYTYTDDGLLETVLVSDKAHHKTFKDASKAEVWAAFGNVTVQNVIKQETMETDTIYWDQGTHQIYTDCYIKMYSPSGFMQGYGMRSDDKARDAVIMKPFNSYSVVVQDTTAIIIDSANFIGPFLKK